MSKQNLTLNTVIFVSVLSLLYAFVPAHASHPTGVVDSSWDGIAIKGYDVVAYRTMGRAVEGNHDFTHNWLNLTWQFDRAEHRDLFAADPVAYAPQYGGYCASAPSVDGKPDVNPTAFKIVDNNLYLFFSHKGMDTWVNNKSEVRSAERIWKRVKNGLAQ